MGVLKKAVPEKYFCEQCQPRELSLNARQAAAAQKRQLAVIVNVNAKKKAVLKRHSTSSADVKMKIGRVRGRPPIQKKRFSTGPLISNKSFAAGKFNESIGDRRKDLQSASRIESLPEAKNHYTRGVKSLMAGQPDSQIDVVQVQNLKDNPLTRQMYVAPNVEGLVATPGQNSQVLPGTLLIEYNGFFSLLSEVSIRSPNRINQHNFTLIYSGLGQGSELFVDASKNGSIARSARRSCHPNAAIQHAFFNGQLHIYLCATAEIENSTEVTIPFDFDFWESKVSVDCACGLKKAYAQNASGGHCPVQEFNEALKDPINFQHIKLMKKSEPNRTASMQRESMFKDQTGKESSSDERYATAPTKRDLKSPKNETEESDQSKESDKALIQGSRLRSRNTSLGGIVPDEPFLAKPAGSSTIRTRSSIGLIPKEEKLTKLESESSSKNSKQSMVKLKTPLKKIEAKQEVMEISKFPSSSSSNANGLAALAVAYRRSVSNSATKNTPTEPSPTVPKRGRPPGSKMERMKLKEEIKKEIGSGIPQKLTREERKMQAQIALMGSMEEREQHKKRKQEPINAENLSPSKKVKMETTKESISVKLNIGKLCDELVSVLRSRMEYAKAKQPFKLPPEFDELRTKCEKVKDNKNARGSPRKRDIAQSKQGATALKWEGVQQKDSQQDEVLAGESKMVDQPKSEETGGNEAACGSETAAAMTSMEAARQPNTKAIKKITIDEYKRKRMAEMGKLQTENTQGLQTLGEDSKSKTAPTTRQSPRKSFIPTIDSIPSPPQQLEDFPTLSPIASMQQKQPLLASTSINELKKRILGNSGGELPSQPAGLSSPSSLPLEMSSSCSASIIGGGQQQHPPLPSGDVTTTVPASSSSKSSEHYKSPRMSLDERLRARFGSSTSAGRPQ